MSTPQDSVPRQRTQLSPEDEQKFMQWYQQWAQKAQIDPDPDNPLHKYDYRGAYQANVVPEINPEDQRYHWPSRFKDADHPNRFVKGVDTRATDQAEPANYDEWVNQLHR